MRTILVAILVLLRGGALLSQGLDQNRYVVVIHELDDRLSAKQVTEAMVDFDADGTYLIDVPSRTLDLTIGRDLSRPELEVYLAPYGFTVSAFSNFGAMGGTGKMNGSDSPDGLSIFHYIGDPADDNLNYEIAKLNWIAAHPQEYQQIKGVELTDD